MSGSTLWKSVAAVAIVVTATLAISLVREERAADTDDGEKVVWKYSVWGPPRAFTRGIEKAKEMWETAGKGRFELQIVYASALSPEKENLDSIQLLSLIHI